MLDCFKCKKPIAICICALTLWDVLAGVVPPYWYQHVSGVEVLIGVPDKLPPPEHDPEQPLHEEPPITASVFVSGSPAL